MVEIDSEKYYYHAKKKRLHAFLPEYCSCGAHRNSGWLISNEHRGLIILLCLACGWEERYKKVQSSEGSAK